VIESAANPDTTIFDAMRDASIERVRFKRTEEGTRVLAARRDDAWAQCRELLPTSQEDIETVAGLFELGGHERFDLVYREEIGLRLLCAVHSSRLGPGAGGLRRHELSDSEIDVIKDVLNLARMMTYKNTVADLGRGGSKICVHHPDIPSYAREEWLQCLVEEIDISGTITGPDSGYDGSVFRDLAALSTNVTGVLAGGTSRSAASGVFAAIKATVAALGQAVPETKIAIQGLGNLGTYLAEDLCNDGAALIVTDKDHRRIDAFLGSLTPDARKRVDVRAPYQILDSECDIFSPCAIGGVIGQETIDKMQVRAICGGANNQLMASSLEHEMELARSLMDHNILFVPDWLASAGGAIHGIMERDMGDEFEPRLALARINRVCGWMVDEVLALAKATGTSPLDIAVNRYLRA
jgi:leucine dehydrogenase